MNTSTEPEIAAALLRDTGTIRTRANALLARARAGQSEWFTISDDTALNHAAKIVADVTRERYGDGPIPYHSRWRHFEAGGVDRRAEMNHALSDVGIEARARAHIDLAVVSVLLDAGAGGGWRYVEAATGQSFSRSEGLGVASFRAFASGLFSSNTQRPFQADAAGLRAVTADQLGAAFQVSLTNPLIGLEGRVALLHRLGEALAAQPEVFGRAARPGGFFDALTKDSETVAAHDVLSLLLNTLATVWPAANHAENVALGDCWPHRAACGAGASDGWMPFHKLSQWLTYSLIEPLKWAGVTASGLDALTGLPEYRNGGLLLDAGVIVPKHASSLDRTWQVGDEFIVEWRALTVALLDELAPRVRKMLGKTEADMPLACVLEGGTWAAGRMLAQQLRGGAPPLKIVSDGTVF